MSDYGRGQPMQVRAGGRVTCNACTVVDCERSAFARGYCSKHYSSERRAGRLEPLRAIPHEDLFWSKVDKFGPGGCWIWTGERKPAGYGVFSRNRYGKKFAHRHSYELLVGPIPEGLEVDHLCRVTSCVNPDHLEPVTPAENRRRAAVLRKGETRNFYGRQPRALMPACRRGHPFDEENTAYYPDGKRRCRACHRENERRRNAARREGE